MSINGAQYQNLRIMKIEIKKEILRYISNKLFNLGYISDPSRTNSHVNIIKQINGLKKQYRIFICNLSIYKNDLILSYHPYSDYMSRSWINSKRIKIPIAHPSFFNIAIDKILKIKTW